MTSWWSDLVSLSLPHNTAVVLRGVTMLGIACGAIGTFLLLRRRSLVADALSHAALPGVCLGYLTAIAIGLDGRPLWLLLLGATAAGLLGVAALHALTALPRVKEDAAIGVVLSVFFAFGVVLLSVIQNLPAGHRAGLHHFIFGQAATMRAADSNLIAIMAMTTLIVMILAFKELRLLCFDAQFARTLGFSRAGLDALLLILITIMTVIGLHAVGALLMVALLIVPAAASRFWTDRLVLMAIIAAAFGGLSTFAGTAASATIADMPTGPAIVIACGAVFVISMLLAPKRGIVIEQCRRFTLSRRIARQHLLRAMYERGEMAGNHSLPILFDDLLERRRWSPARLQRLVRRLIAAGEIDAKETGYILTDAGFRSAQRVVRSHRLWEHYLTSHADIAPSHVDRAADAIEHVLGEKLTGELEQSLRAKRALRPGEVVPRSPHQLKSGDGGAA